MKRCTKCGQKKPPSTAFKNPHVTICNRCVAGKATRQSPPWPRERSEKFRERAT